MPRRNELLIRCQTPPHHLFCVGMIEDTPDNWRLQRSFEVDDCVANCIGPQEEIYGNFDFDQRYRGCPYCHSQGFVRCGVCGKLSCWDGGDYHCPWCGSHGEVQTTNSMNLHAGGI